MTIIQSYKNKKLKQRLFLFPFFLIALTVMLFSNSSTIHAAEQSIQIYSIDYEAETITLQANAADTCVYYSNASATTWNKVYGTLDSNKRITMDISWITKSSSYTLNFKGDASTKVLKIILPKQSVSFRAALNIGNNTMRFTNTGDATHVYWRKSVSTTWKPLSLTTGEDTLAFQKELERFSQKGITLYFRTGQVMGNSTSVGSRPSKEVSLKIAKRASAPSIKPNYDTKKIPVKSTIEYKRSTDDTWIEISGTTLNLDEIAPEIFYTASNTKPESVSFDFRTKATATKVASQTATLKLPVQEKAWTDNISLEYIGATQCKLSITKLEVKDEDGKTITLPAPSSTTPYEYLISSSGTENERGAKWVTITSSSTIISSEKAPKGSTIFVRRKATSSSLASTSLSYIISDYPSSSSLSTPVDLVKVSGVEDQSLTFVLKVPRNDTKVKSIEFAGKAATFTSSNTVKAKGLDNTYTLTITLKSTADIEAVSENLNTKLNGTITLDNGDVISNGVTLLIYSPTTLVEKQSYEKYKGLPATEEMKFALNLGNEAKKGTTIESIQYEKENLEFTQTEADSNLNITATLKQDSIIALENKLSNAAIGKTVALSVKLSNGETISAGIQLTLKPIATVSSSSNGFGISASAYKAYLEEQEKNSNSDKEKTTTTTPKEAFKNPVVTLTVDPALYAKDNSIMASSITWNGKNVIQSFSVKDNVFTITLDIGKIVNAANLSTTVTNRSANLLVQLKTDDNESYSLIETNYKITVVE